MGKNLYVGNLPDSATEQDLSDKFAVYGTVKSVKLITDLNSYDRGPGAHQILRE